ncbi:MAG: bifunctional glutamate N-acetyltransferase/amino-acid acetyltransferase ArgJ [Planctomycetaceae bacterium]|jgi:glutamate N-acetyltransferase / amino-acid N-acetyltransferase|nr:bifunctional glutamate N-acetyltransferase/amino-acid acetyltransferase ArgJ [Planctomycetaceae bacterium]MBT4013703.1 bifunctional glutamate N-acetyltransferase/amino-acid acetyltransferase ArgJ [Planctomycetaceae bacterium]MBT4725411.1 bifunctional glutamate N-acetyltransferase/amino-acid acetyltransferase ArgJ [Planctomycetaceae bacterium]MBT5123218.1 bifunctional glutamate N-acetyltransferase/amino-acid acetyltransferase ArgJ [Planctomycetaceae bacterium]MBT5597666.1 bifunctional glutama
MANVELPQGYKFSGHHSGVKTDEALPDYSIFASETDAVCVGVYTQNLVCAAPVHWCRDLTPNAACRAIVVNSGNANACTGQQGRKDVEAMASAVAAEMNIDKSQVLVMSTGIIGVHLDMDKMGPAAKNGCDQLSSTAVSFLAAARGILTTDKSEKVVHRSIETSQGEVRFSAVAKGAGMIGPNMATMLACVLTDAKLSPDDAQHMLTASANTSFNCISVEGHTSTNDTMLLMANGKSNSVELAGNDLELFADELTSALIELAKMIPADGEGATHLMEIAVSGAETNTDARKVANSIANSNLVKTCVAGGDPNWGRIVSAAGYAGVNFELKELQLHLNGYCLFQNEMPVPFDAVEVAKSMQKTFVTSITLVLGRGAGRATIWSSDLTCDYVKFNSDYHT